MRALRFQLTRKQKNSLDPLRQISPHLHPRKHPQQYDCYTDIRSRKNCCTSKSLPLTKKEKERIWTKTIITIQNHGTQHLTSPMQITKQRKSSFSYLLTVSKIDFIILRHLITFFCASDRLVESPRMKRALEAVYQGILPKGSSPFIYLRFSLFSHLMKIADGCLSSLQIDPRSVDVNVHPTKREVHFLNEEAITERIADALQQNLAKQNHSRVFEYQAGYIA